MPTVKRTAAQWQQIFDEQQQSGLAVKHYCELHHLTLSNFYLWRKKLTNSKPKPTAQTDEQNWQEIALPEFPSPDTQVWLIELNLPNGVTLKMRAE